MLYDADGRVVGDLKPPTAEELAELARQNAAARKKFDAELAADAARKSAARIVEAEAAFKAACRPKYAALSNEDFERLWLTTIRDQELLARAAAEHQQRLAEYSEFQM